MKRGTRNLLSKQKLYFVSQIICVLPYIISKYISVPPLIFPYHNQHYLWNKDNYTNLDKSLKRRMTFVFEVLCCCTLSISSSCSKEPPSKATQIPREWPKSSDWQALHSGLILSQLFQPKLLLFSFNPTIAVIFFLWIPLFSFIFLFQLTLVKIKYYQSLTFLQNYIWNFFSFPSPIVSPNNTGT